MYYSIHLCDCYIHNTLIGVVEYKKYTIGRDSIL